MILSGAPRLLIAAIIWCSLLHCFPLLANEVPVSSLGTEQGLSNSSATCITQDKYGFIWIGTYDGLNRYDGYQFKTFRNVWGNPQSIVNNKIKTIAAVGYRLFVGTEKGAVYFNYKDSRFHALYHKRGNEIVKIDCNINQMLADKAGNVYAATNRLGLLYFKNGDTIARKIGYCDDIKKNGVQSIMLDAQAHLWVFINGKGLGIYHAKTNRIAIQSQEIISGNCLMPDQDGNIWIGNNSGLFIYDKIKHRVSAFENKQRKLSASNISSLLFTSAGEMWISTNGAGINIWNPLKQTLRYLLPGESGYNLQSGAVASVFEDNEHRKWIATLWGGVNVIDIKRDIFKGYSHSVSNPNSLAGNFVRSFCEDEKHNLWIGTDGSGVSYWDTQSNRFQNYYHQAGRGYVSSNYVVSIIKDHRNQIWTASFNGGIDAFDPAEKKFKHYTCYKAGTKTEEKNFWKLFEDHDHRLWAASTWGGALYLYNRGQDKFEIFDRRLMDMHTLYEDHNGVLWGGDYVHLVHIDVKNKRHYYYYIGQPIRAIAEDANGQLCIGTEGGGLLIFDQSRRKFRRYTQKDGLPNNAVLNILTDSLNNLWCSTYNGLTNFNQKTRKFHNYSVSDGLQSNQFLYNAAIKLQSGDMIFGGIKGFNRFNPDSVSISVHQPPLRLTDFSINNIPLSNTPYAKGNPLNEIKEIRIPFSQATLAIGFTALEYSFPEKISYAYYLEGWDHGWNFVDKAKTAYYSRLNEGSYMLKIKATNSEGGWEASPLTVRIVVLPPWYRTWWAFMCYLILAGLLIHRFWAYRKQKLKLAYEVEIANLKVEKEKELNERKLSFFTNIAHEFRTPLTLIINPIKDLLKSKRNEDEELNLIYRNARRLLGLVDHLLLFRKTESENTALTLSRVDFVECSRDVYQCFVQQAKIRHIKYTYTATPGQIMMCIDRVKIEIALFNLISNAVKFTPDGGEIHLTVNEEADSVYFQVADSGIGIESQVGERLFEKYYQVKDERSFKIGFGIGLYLVKTFIENHEGTVSYESKPGNGTVFTLCLPKLNRNVNLQQPSYEDKTVSEILPVISNEEHDDHTVNEDINHLELLISDAKSMLIIDDNVEISSYIRSIFSSEFTVYLAADGDTGLKMIRQYVPDIVISDIVMPGLSGMELCQIVKNDSTISHIPIILLTGESADDLRLRGIEEGAVDFIQKPFDKNLLVARVRGVIKNKKELQHYFYKEITLQGKSKDISEENKLFLYKCIEVIEGLLNEPSFEMKTIAEELGMSYSSLFKRIKSVTGYSVNNFIRFVRLRKAAEILINTNCNVNEAAFRVGYSDIKYFREHFTRQFGMKPSEFIKRHRSAFQKNYRFVSHSVER
ncbi:hybrid sensor histidine kinase/response regulator transcription factor [Mucilaginibacter sp. KACC 22063]|uniref:hybrid sensor histidine kinase/response regulator transcription factor n=1 Tax=Mucilaginibacter sp. KACC 22063 TaxID=3025666 RepID=UPI002366118D|nr:two-component regulator propeller domain-containing protein [Mucilaginibacter sp. KACC 22063]WDF56170.1 two-component regulator propeller domain-containing protein [Mucilaginibacter sp. KACC 22063]